MISAASRHLLLEIALASIIEGIQNQQPLSPNPKNYAADLQAKRATFVTLNANQQLRGCIGTLEAHQPLVIDVAHNAFSAAFRDTRFPPLEESELATLDIHISILSPTEPIKFSDEKDLVQQLRPGIDGLILTDGYHRGTFLPAVWESLPDPVEFLTHLKMKAGLAANHWGPSVEIERYTVESIP